MVYKLSPFGKGGLKGDLKNKISTANPSSALRTLPLLKGEIFEYYMDKIRVRFAPSPTGYMHIGNFRTALYTYIFAKKNKGDFILRVEDTDQKRYIPDALEKLIKIINWAGFEYNEGVFLKTDRGSTSLDHNDQKRSNLFYEKGDYGPYIQSERLDIYKKHAEQLLKLGHAYYCFCTPERLEEMRKNQLANKQAPMYDRTCLKLTKEEVEDKLKKGELYVIRQKINTEGITEFDDMVRGKVQIKNELLDDQVLLKSDGYPTYNFANVIDDHLMEITHVIRGEEYISSTPKYIQLYQNFDWKMPEIAHLPLLLNTDRTKLSKRQGDVAVEEYIAKGYLKNAIINFVALLGWNPGEGSTQEIFSFNELVEKFDLKKVHKAGAVFDSKKLDWLNSRYIKKLSIDELYDLALPFLEKKDFFVNPSPLTPLPEGEADKKDCIKKVLTIEQERLNKLSGVGESNKFFFQDINYGKELLHWKDMNDNDIISLLEKAVIVLAGIKEEDWTRKNLEEILLEAAGEKRGEFLWPLRAALTGEKKSPPPGEVAWVLGKKESTARIKNAISIIKNA